MLALIAGITGSLGQRIAKVAFSRGLLVRGLGRNRGKLDPEVSQQLESFITSESYYDIPALDKAVAGVDAVICAYSPDHVLDLDGHLLLLRAAERADIKVFIASSWNNDWLAMKFGELEHYDNHIAFENSVAITSKIRPAYLFNGTDLLYTPFGPRGFDTSSTTPKLKYWGDSNTRKRPWITQDDAAV